mgnify:CR=1 FL=1
MWCQYFKDYPGKQLQDRFRITYPIVFPESFLSSAHIIYLFLFIFLKGKVASPFFATSPPKSFSVILRPVYLPARLSASAIDTLAAVAFSSFRLSLDIATNSSSVYGS